MGAGKEDARNGAVDLGTQGRTLTWEFTRELMHCGATAVTDSHWTMKVRAPECQVCLLVEGVL